MSVTKSNGSLQIPQARGTGSLQEKQVKDTRCTLSMSPPSTSPLLLPPSVCFFRDCATADIKFPDLRVSTYTDDNAAASTMEDDGGKRVRCKVHPTHLTPHKNSGTVWRYFVASLSLLSLCLLLPRCLDFLWISSVFSLCTQQD